MSKMGGDAYTLAPLSARSVGGNSAELALTGWRRAVLVLNVTASATDAGDTLDVYVDVSPDGGTTWVNAVHFAQQAGNGAAKKEIAVLDTSNPGADTVVVTSDAAAAKVRPAVFGDVLRARWAIADADANASHTFSVTGYIW